MEDADFSELRAAVASLADGRAGLRQLFWRLGYDYADALLPPLPDAAKTLFALLAEPPRLIATTSGGDFHVLWFPLRTTSPDAEKRAHIHCRALFPYALYVFSEPACQSWRLACPSGDFEAGAWAALTLSSNDPDVRQVRTLALFAQAREDSTGSAPQLQSRLASACRSISTATTITDDEARRSRTEAEGPWQDGLSWLLTQTRGRLLSASEEGKLARRIARGDAEAKNVLVAANLRLVVSISRRYFPSGLDAADLFQEGVIGLIRAAEKFDPAQGHRFSTYAYHWIRQSMGRAVQNQARQIRLPAQTQDDLRRIKDAGTWLLSHQEREPSPEEIAAALPMPEAQVIRLVIADQEIVSLDEPAGDKGCLRDCIEDPQSAAPHDIESLCVLRSALREAMDRLKPREREVLVARYGLRDEGGDALFVRTLEEVGQQMGVTRERVRQIEEKALRRLRRVYPALDAWVSGAAQDDPGLISRPASARASAPIRAPAAPTYSTEQWRVARYRLICHVCEHTTPFKNRTRFLHRPCPACGNVTYHSQLPIRA